MIRWTAIALFTALLSIGMPAICQTWNPDGTTLSSYKLSNCLTNCSMKSEVISSELNKGVLNLKIGGHLNCIVNENSKITYTIHGDTLNIIVSERQITIDTIIVKTDSSETIEITETSMTALCRCFFHMDLVIHNCKAMPNTILINGLSLADNYNRRTIIEDDK